MKVEKSIKIERLIAQVSSMRQVVAIQLDSLTNPAITFNCADEFLRLTQVRAILIAERLEDLEKELVQLKLYLKQLAS